VRAVATIPRLFAALAFWAMLHASPGKAEAHGGLAATAEFLAPVGLENWSAGDAFTLTWTDTDRPIPTGTATIDFFYTGIAVPTNAFGTIPEIIRSFPIASGILESDRQNQVRFDTTPLPTGHYQVWSVINEPPLETALGTPTVTTRSRGYITVIRDNEIPPPAVLITRPDSPFAFADEQLTIRYATYDPDQSAQVRLTGQHMDSGEVVVIGETLPSTATATVTWATQDLASGEWMIRGDIEDRRGERHSTYARFFVLVSHRSTPPDAGSPSPPAAMQPPNAINTPSSGCTASPAGQSSDPMLLLLGFLLGLQSLRRRCTTSLWSNR
jgi:hypothetical protein